MIINVPICSSAFLASTYQNDCCPFTLSMSFTHFPVVFREEKPIFKKKNDASNFLLLLKPSPLTLFYFRLSPVLIFFCLISHCFILLILSAPRPILPLIPVTMVTGVSIRITLTHNLSLLKHPLKKTLAPSKLSAVMM